MICGTSGCSRGDSFPLFDHDAAAGDDPMSTRFSVPGERKAGHHRFVQPTSIRWIRLPRPAVWVDHPQGAVSSFCLRPKLLLTRPLGGLETVDDVAPGKWWVVAGDPHSDAVSEVDEYAN